MRLTFCGAAGEVTGSAYHLETRDARVLIDFGLFQGGRQSEVSNRRVPPFDASRIDAAILTHAHIDHAGRLPMLPAMGFKSPIYATPATVDLSAIMLADAARLQDLDASYASLRNARRGLPPVAALYSESEARRVCELFRPVGFDQPTEIAPGVMMRLVDSGHILGSASIELVVREGAVRKTLIFSGDIGHKGLPITHDPTPLTNADLVVMESTYGDRDHRPLDQTVAQFNEIIKRAVWEKQRVMVPAFSVGRTQTLMYHLSELGRTGTVPQFPVYIDSPMAIESTRLYRKHQAILDGAGRDLLAEVADPRGIPDFRFTPTGDDSRRLNTLEGAAVVIAGSGMSTGGRILHHYKHFLWRKDACVLIVGYQSDGTLGRRLVEGAKMVRVRGEWIAVRATIHTLNGLSAHADQSGLVSWASAWSRHGPRVYLTHGEPRAQGPLVERLKKELGIEAVCPAYGEAVEL